MTDIAATTTDYHHVFYRKGEVLAIGEAAKSFVGAVPGVSHTDDDDIVRSAPPGTRIPPRPTIFRFKNVDDPELVVSDASSRGLQVQLNHIFFAHCGCGCGPCCAGNPYGAFPLKATPLKATAFTANPLKATATNRTTAEPTDPATLPPVPESDALPGVAVWILDTGKTDGNFQTMIDNRVSGDPEDNPDLLPVGAVDKVVDPVAGHGTFIAGIIERLVPGCTLKIKRAIDGDGLAEEAAIAIKIEQFMNEAAQDDTTSLDRTILNLSFGGGLSPGISVIAEEITAAQQAGVVVVASAGNDGSCAPVYPAALPGVTAVGAIDAEGDPAPFTNRGAWVNACALGVDIVSTFFDLGPNAANFVPSFKNGWAMWSGTSFATPVVVAAIAEVLGTEPGLTAFEAREAVLANGASVPCLGIRVDPAEVEGLLQQ